MRYHGSRNVIEVWWDRIYICIVNECVIWNHILTCDVLLQIPAHGETVLDDVLTRYVRNTKYFIHVFSLCFEEAVGHVLRVEYAAGSKPTSRPPPMKCLDLECNFEALGVKWTKTNDLKNYKLKSSTNEKLAAGFVNEQERVSSLCVPSEVGTRHYQNPLDKQIQIQH